MFRVIFRSVNRLLRNLFGVNVPLLYPNIEEIMAIILKSADRFTSAENPKRTAHLKAQGIKVVHVIANKSLLSNVRKQGWMQLLLKALKQADIMEEKRLLPWF
jgi:enoyl-[acyl-carrier protein] reductase II